MTAWVCKDVRTALRCTRAAHGGALRRLQRTVPPFDLQRLNPAGSLSSPGRTLCDFVASLTELDWRAGDCSTRFLAGRLDVRVGATLRTRAGAAVPRGLHGRRTTGKGLPLPVRAADGEVVAPRRSGGPLLADRWSRAAVASSWTGPGRASLQPEPLGPRLATWLRPEARHRGRRAAPTQPARHRPSHRASRERHGWRGLRHDQRDFL